MGYSYRWLSEHIPLIINKQVMTDLQSSFASYFDVTSSHPTRQRNGIQYEFAYINWLMEAPKSQMRNKIDPYLYRTRIVGTDDFHYISYGSGTTSQNRQKLKTILNQQDRIKFLCIQDNIDYSNENKSSRQLNEIQELYQALFPDKSKYEK